MAYHGKAYGYSAEVKAKQAAKYDPALESAIRRWLEGVSHKSIGHDFQGGLKDGVILCEVINRIRPGSVRKINQGNMPFKCMENIQNFLGGCRSAGVNEADLFAVVDLYEAKNMTLVLQGLAALGRIDGGRSGCRYVPPGGGSVGNINSAPSYGGSTSSPGVPRNQPTHQSTGSSNSGLYGAKYGGGADATNTYSTPQPKYGQGATKQPSYTTKSSSNSSSAGPPMPARDAGAKFCGECGQKRPNLDAKFCGGCGNKF
eukprot:CAMPEP_0201507362 /NCGR_PEP_ID=MMETSP0161_2-20130828/1043_1 /ASSEMBLY_ACC=CAM_ASM_000251 /TAXON_ID=180227 /ORGANISM="Neoparamoeba aestuarina, Strain SoJaBio B1-5/56/2" /LENGTH=257 /DNA_ID=CAMNT_0047901701 /DNA_START=110 /DNA_END=883 /DNA_ORIENTATION=-